MSMTDLVVDEAENGTATFSPCRTYRYLLVRTDLLLDNSRTLLWMMLNPPSGDPFEDDKTMGRCKSFSVREGFGRLAVVNVYAYIAKRPRIMLDAEDPIGPMNDIILQGQIEKAEMIVAAWGGRTRTARELEVRSLLRRYGSGRTKMFGLTTTGKPQHPLMQFADQPLIPFI